MACASDCINPLRIKHDDYLKKAKANAHKLVVIVNNDA